MEAGPCSPFMNRLCVILLSLHSIKCTTEDQGSFWQLQATYCRLESIFTLCNLQDCAMHVCTLMYVALLFLHEGTTDARWCANQNWCAIDIFWYFRVSLYLWGPLHCCHQWPYISDWQHFSSLLQMLWCPRAPVSCTLTSRGPGY